MERVIADKKAIVLELEPGTYFWCTCGRSQCQPFCDGSHAFTPFQPLEFKITEKKKYSLCTCKYTERPPFCDGAHKKFREEIFISHSPDTDDELMFWALRKGKVSDSDFTIRTSTADTEELNRRAADDLAPHITAISVAAYAAIADRYIISTAGASIGRDYGPVICTLPDHSLNNIVHPKIAIPGARTTAAALTRRYFPDAELIEIPIEPYQQIYQALAAGEVDAVTLIHEGQLMYQQRGLALVLDLGARWFTETKLPLPLGVNVIRRDLGSKISRLNRLCTDSIRYGIDHLEELLPELIEKNITRGSDTTTAESIRTYISRYVNHDSLQLDTDVRAAIRTIVGEDVPIRVGPIFADEF